MCFIVVSLPCFWLSSALSVIDEPENGVLAVSEFLSLAGFLGELGC